MNSLPLRLVLAGLLGTAATLTAGPIGPIPYVNFPGIPLNQTFSYFHLENFEDGVLNTPGVSVNTGVILGPGSLTDSVDEDDGSIDGLGTSGRSLFTNALTNQFIFQFDALALGLLPTYAGMVWTDVGNAPIQGVGLVEFEAFDSSGISLGITSATLGDGLSNGGTAEDRFFGFINSTGISRIEIRMPSSTDWEVDHLQYGASVPEPAAFGLVGVALCGLLAHRRFRK